MLLMLFSVLVSGEAFRLEQDRDQPPKRKRKAKDDLEVGIVCWCLRCQAKAGRKRKAKDDLEVRIVCWCLGCQAKAAPKAKTAPKAQAKAAPKEKAAPKAKAKAKTETRISTESTRICSGCGAVTTSDVTWGDYKYDGSGESRYRVPAGKRCRSCILAAAWLWCFVILACFMHIGTATPVSLEVARYCAIADDEKPPMLRRLRVWQLKHRFWMPP